MTSQLVSSSTSRSETTRATGNDRWPAGTSAWPPSTPTSKTDSRNTANPHTQIFGRSLLRRHGLSRRAAPAREPANSYEWPCPGDLLHMDVSRYARFLRPGHAVTGDRHRTAQEKRDAVGYDFAHAIGDEHSRLAYAELHDDEKAATVTGFLERGLAFFAAHRITAKRLLTDNAFSYVHTRSLRELLARHGIRHLTTEPSRPRTNGKVERFHQTMAREWAHGLSYQTHQHRNAALPHWLDNYNRQRPHSSIGDRPPISRVHNLCR